MIKSNDFRKFKINLSHFEDALLEITPSGSSDEEDHYQELIRRKISQLPMKETPRLYL